MGHRSLEIFLSTLSLRRATRRPIFFWQAEEISIHALLAESDTIFLPSCVRIPVFLSTLSLRRATRLQFICKPGQYYFYPRSPCGERPWARGSRVTYVEISIHALLAESDKRIRHRREKPRHFYPRSPCGERPRGTAWQCVETLAFLSTLSLRRATPFEKFEGVIAIFLSTLSLRRATISGATRRIFLAFLSTLSLRRATNTKS